jgi:hypothetical protein
MGYLYPQLIKRAGALSNYILAEDGSTQIALFTYASNVTTLEGGDTAGDDFIVKANSSQTYPKISLSGGSTLNLYSANDTRFFASGTRKLQIAYASNLTTITAGNVTGDDLVIKSNTIDNYPFIAFNGDGAFQIASKGRINIFIETTEVARFNDDGALHLLECDTPAALTNYGAIYTKNDNKLYFQDGAGTEHEIAFA